MGESKTFLLTKGGDRGKPRGLLQASWLILGVFAALPAYAQGKIGATVDAPTLSPILPAPAPAVSAPPPSPAIRLAPTATVEPLDVKPPVVIEPPRNVPQGNLPAEVLGPSALPPISLPPPLVPGPKPAVQSLGTPGPDVSAPQGAGGDAALMSPPSASNARSGLGIGEVLPGSSELGASMQILPNLNRADPHGAPSETALKPGNACVSVVLRPDGQRPATTLVDLTGDGLIVSPIANARVDAVFERAGYSKIDLSRSARWCIAQAAVRELLQTGPVAPLHESALLVQTPGGWQLMPKEQWLAQQASLQPLASANSGTARTSIEFKPEVGVVKPKTNRLARKPLRGLAAAP
jgi:hypothetical protein